MASILSTKLQISDLPNKKANWPQIAAFASTFDIATECPEGSQITGIRDISPSSGVVDLRLALYAEWRRYNHFHQEPDPATLQQAQEVLSLIRWRLERAE